MKLSTSEQQLVDFAKEQFGEHLTGFLLTGLGEEVKGRQWDFTIAYTRDDGKARKRRVVASTHVPEEGEALLPRRRDPLVLLALLRLLMKDEQVLVHDLSYDQKDVLKLLGWSDTERARKEIDEAVRRYALLVLEWKKKSVELYEEKLSYYTASEKLITECYRLSEGTEEGQMVRVHNRVVFNSNFIERLMNHSLFEIDWKRVRSLKMVCR